MRHDHELISIPQLELADTYLRARSMSSSPVHSPELDATLAFVLRELQTPPPDERFVERLREELRVAAISPSFVANTTPRAHRLARAWVPLLGLVLIVVVSAAAIAVASSGEHSVNALEILSQTNATLNGTRAAPVTSFVMTSSLTVQTGAGASSHSTLEIHRWVLPPDKWRSEAYIVGYDSAGNLNSRETLWVLVSDGTTEWRVGRDGSTIVGPATSVSAGLNSSITLLDFGLNLGQGSLTDALTNAGKCFEPRYLGKDRVAGRVTFVIDLGQNRCVGESKATNLFPDRLWIDQDTFAILKLIAKDDDQSGNGVSVEYHVTALILDVVISPSVFVP